MKTPAAKREVLVFLAGLVWSSVGLLLVIMAIFWLIRAEHFVVLMSAVGIVGAMFIHHYGFSKLAEKNLVRIYSQAPNKERVCVFAFQNTRSYVIVPVMILMGYTLRHLPVAKIYLVPVYLSIGLSMLLASLRYYLKLRNPY